MLPLTLTLPQPSQVRRRSQLPGSCPLRAGSGEGPLEMRLRFRRVLLGRHQLDFAGRSVDLRLAPFFLGCLHQIHRFADASPRLLELPKLRMGAGQARQKER